MSDRHPSRPSLARMSTRVFLGVILLSLAPTLVAGPEPAEPGAVAPDDASTGGSEAPPEDCREQTRAVLSELDATRARVRDLEAELRSARTEQEACEQRAGESAQAAATLRAERDRLSNRLETLESQCATQRQGLAKARRELEAVRARLAESEERAARDESKIRGLETRLAELQAERARLEGELAARGRRIAALQRESAAERVGLRTRLAGVQRELGQALERIHVLESRLPPVSGGTASVEAARQRAAAAARAYLEAYRRARASAGERTPELARAQAALFHAQALLAGLEGARGVYTVTARDSLSQIAARTLGNGNRWIHIHAANRHVLEDPNHLTPGLVLVIP